MLRKFARTARERIRLEGGGYRRMGSKGDLLRALAAASGASLLYRLLEIYGNEPLSRIRFCWSGNCDSHIRKPK